MGCISEDDERALSSKQASSRQVWGDGAAGGQQQGVGDAVKLAEGGGQREIASVVCGCGCEAACLLPAPDPPSIFNCTTAGVCAVHPNRPPPAQDPPPQPAAAPPAGPGAVGR